MALPDWLRHGLMRNLSRHPGDVAETFGGDRWLLAKIDVGAFGSKGSASVPDGPALVMAGEPLLMSDTSSGCQSRALECQRIYEELCSNQNKALQASTGTFCGAHYSPHLHQLTLITDKLGVRPIYYIITPEFAAFTSALRIFEAVGLGVSEIDLHGVYETCAFGFPLGDRTCYSRIRAIGPAELIHITGESETHSRYFRWDQLKDTTMDEPVLIRKLVSEFEDGIRRRLHDDKITLSHLSGGLDSRAIVAALRKTSAEVITLNCAPAGTQDSVFGALAARAFGTVHHQVDVTGSKAIDSFRADHPHRWREAPEASMLKPDRPSCVWSGNGGSVGLGHVYLDPETVGIFERGELAEGIRSFLQYNRLKGVSNSAMSPGFRKRTRDWHIDGVREQLLLLERRLDGRALHLFLMLNDQRRHLAGHFEDVDVDRFEFKMPFYDANFLETIVRAPVRPFLRHEFYIKWLKALNPLAVTVPWQVYPNHEPCPVPYEGELRYQWSNYYAETKERQLFRRQRNRALGGLFSRPFPHHLISRHRFAAAILTSLLGSTSFGHLIRVGDTFVRFWQQSQREHCSGAPILHAHSSSPL